MATGERLRIAREAQNRDLADVASAVGIEASLLEELERDAQEAEPEVLWNLGQDLGQNLTFFLRTIPVTGLTVVGGGMTKLDDASQTMVTAQARIWLEQSYDIESFYPVEDIPVFVPPDGFPLPGATPRDAAQAGEALRDAWSMPSLPIAHLIDMLDDVGMRIAVIDGTEGFEAVALQSDDDLALPLIAVHRDLSGEAQRYAIAREFAYFVLEGATAQTAGHFAASFLIPGQALQQELGPERANVTLFELQLVKQKFGVSMRRILMRAASLKIISRETLDEWLAIFEEHGWNTVEAGAAYPPELPGRLPRLALRLQAEGEIEAERAAELLGVPEDEWDDLINLRA